MRSSSPLLRVMVVPLLLTSLAGCGVSSRLSRDMEDYTPVASDEEYIDNDAYYSVPRGAGYLDLDP